MAEVDRVLGNDEKCARRARWSGARARSAVGDSEKWRSTTSWRPGNGAASLEGFRRPAPVPSCRCRTAATIAAPSASSRYGRGNSRSVPMGRGGRAGPRGWSKTAMREIVLTGVDITSYGADLPGAPKLGALVKQILKHVPELKRLRLSSIDSVEADERSARCDRRTSTADAASASVAAIRRRSDPQAHEAAALARRRDQVLRAQVRRLRPDMAFGADIIAGFPTETEAMFARSLDLVDECGLTHLHVFRIRPRPGTPAARMPQLPRQSSKTARGACASNGAGGVRASISMRKSARRGWS
jgi:threonylcarbamoyladenosine tRNA methylthiotransferase MtaB